MSKNYYVGDANLSPEESKNVKEFTEAQDDKVKEIGIAQKAKEQDKKVVTLEELLATTLKPQEDRIIVWRDKADGVTAGGIIVPETVQQMQKPSRGTVIRVGPGKANDNLTQEILCEILRVMEDKTNRIPVSGDYDSRITTSTSNYKPGDRILFGRFAGTPVDCPTTGEELLIMRPSDIFSIL